MAEPDRADTSGMGNADPRGLLFCMLCKGNLIIESGVLEHEKW